jgi:YHS domain-containing protein
MADTQTLSQRIKAEFDSRTTRVKAAEQQKVQESEAREERLARFTKLCEDLKAEWRPRFDEFAKQFGDKIKVTPTVTPSQREAKIAFMTDLATMNLTLSIAPNLDATSVVLDYDLLIIPIFFDYERHARLEMPLDKVDRAKIGKWIEDQLISCVKAYLSMQDNEFYLKRSTVEDPVTHAKFLRGDAAATLEHKGTTYYFSSQESLKQYKEKLQITT